MPRVARPEASDQLARQWALLRLLRSGRAGGYSVRELGEQLSTSKSNVERDLSALERAGFPLRRIPDPKHRQRQLWAIDKDAADEVGNMRFGAAELLALYASSSVLEFMMGTPVHMDLQNVLAKVRGTLAESGSKAVQRMAGVFTPHLRNFVSYEGEDRRAILDDLMDATARRRCCRVTYQSAEAKAPKSYVIRPLRIFAHHNALYVFVQIGEREEVRTLVVHRLLELETLDETFEVPHANLDEYSLQAFGVQIEKPEDVEIIFEKDAVRYVEERTFHPREQKERLKDGRLRYKVRAGGRNELIAWVISFGGSAELIAPAAWRADVVERARKLMGAHSSR
ncbi:MAG: WYL domain-containing transcriptional regulator [Myxococcota bacterium]